MAHRARISAFLAAVLSGAGVPAAAAEAQAAARATIVEPMVLRMQWALAMPSVRGSLDGAAFMGTMPSMAMGMMMPANARLILRREDDTGETVTAPIAFEVTARGAGGLVVRTAMTADVRLAAGGIANGILPGRTAASIDVARGLILTATGGAAPDAPATLVVMVQYN